MKKILNIASGQVRLVVNGLVGLFVTKLCITQLGQDKYAEIAVLLSFIAIFTLLGNATTDACVKFISKAAARNNWEEAEVFIINAVAVAFWITLAACLCSGLAEWCSPNLIGRLPVLFVFWMLSGVFLTFLSGIYTTGNFYNESFLSSATIFSIGRLVYAAASYYCIVHLKMDYWGIAAGSFAGASFTAAGAYLLFKRNLARVSMRLRNLSFKKQASIVSFIGWMLFVYCGTYCASSAILLIANNYASGSEIARLALGLQVGSIAAQILTCFSLVTSPGIYRALAKGDEKLASRYLQLLLDLALPASICGLLIVYFGGDQILHLWLGDHAPPNMVPVLLGSFGSFSLVSICIPFCAYYAAANRIRIYGLACLIESLLICLGSFLLLRVVHPSIDKIVLITLLPGLLIGLKLVVLCGVRYKGLSVNFLRICRTLLASGMIAAAVSCILECYSLHNPWVIIAIFMTPYSLFLYNQLAQGPSSNP